MEVLLIARAGRFLAYVLVSLVALALIYFRRKRARMVELLDKIPGPPSKPLLGNMLVIKKKKREDFFKLMCRVAETYRPIFRSWIGPYGYVVLLAPDDLEVVLGNMKHIDKSRDYKFIEPWLGRGLITGSGPKWHAHRKILTPAFHFRILEQFVEVFNENCQILVQRLWKEVGKAQFNIFPYITLCTLDVICESAMGTKVNAQKNSRSEYVSAIYRFGILLQHRQTRPWLHPEFVFQWTPTGKEMKNIVRVLHDFSNRVIAERKDLLHSTKEQSNQQQKQDEENGLGTKKRMAFLDLLLEASEDNGGSLSDQDIREEVDTVMFAGHDTTACAINWCIHLLGAHPDVQTKVVEELEEIFGDSDRPATMQDLHQMKYLERCIKETVRLYPSVPIIARQLTEDANLKKYTLPAGCTVLIMTYMVHRNSIVFPNPEEFNPDNFLPEKVQGRHPYAYIPFSAGPRNCIGMKFALLEVKAVVSSVLRNFKLESLDERRKIPLLGEMVLRPKFGLNMRITPRKTRSSYH